MTKRDFCMQYMLNRAIGHTGGLEASAALKSALEGWALLDKECPEPKLPDTPDAPNPKERWIR